MPHADLVIDPDRRALLDRVLARVRTGVLPALPALRAQVIHNDLTLDNLLMDAAGRVTGVIDFGDMTHTPLVLDVPATLQSLVRDRSDIFDVAGAFLSGYTSVVPLERDEGDLLGDLVLGRMAQTILISVWRTRRYPDNAYITAWEEPAWTLLHQLDEVGFEAAGRRLAVLAAAPARAAGGAPPDPGRRSSIGGAGCWAARLPPSAIAARSTSSAAAGHGCRPTGGPSSTPTTTCRWSGTPILGYPPPSAARRRRSTRIPDTCIPPWCSSRSGSAPACPKGWTPSCS